MFQAPAYCSPAIGFFSGCWARGLKAGVTHFYSNWSMNLDAEHQRGVMLFHISEESRIERFEPRASEDRGEPVVWAIDGDHLRNYLLPRDCPRVTFYAGRETTAADVERFLGSSPAVVAVESSWLERLRSCQLYCYHLPPETFECIDGCAGYFVSRVSVVPARVEVYGDPIAELIQRGVEVRFLPSLWPLRDAVVASTLQFSIIRMRNALPRSDRISNEAVSITVT